MKTIYLPLFSILLFFSCTSPQKLLEEGKYLKAHQVSLQKLKQRKIKQEYIYTLEAAYTLLGERHQLFYEKGKAKQQPSYWPRLFTHCKMMKKLQEDTKSVEARLVSDGYQPQLNHLPVEEWLEEARLNSAIYHYSLALEQIPTARNGNQLAARKAYASLKSCRFYISDYRDSRKLTKEMYKLGTTHIHLNLQVDPTQERLESTFFDQVLANTGFPFRQNWQMYHLNAPDQQRIDYDLDLYFSDLYVSGDDCSTSCCSNSKDVCVGYREIEVWSEQDSAYVIEKEPIYETISVTVTTYDQSKSSQVYLNYVYRDRETGNEVYQTNERGTCNWSNSYATYCGNPDAMGLLCSAGGSYSSYPSDWEMLVDAARSLRRVFSRSLELDIEKTLHYSRPSQ